MYIHHRSPYLDINVFFCNSEWPARGYCSNAVEIVGYPEHPTLNLGCQDVSVTGSPGYFAMKPEFRALPQGKARQSPI